MGALFKSCIAAFAVGIVLCGAFPAHAGAWPLPVGEIQIIAPVTFTKANKSYDARRKLKKHSPYEKIEVSPYVEYGLTKSLTLIGELSWFRDHTSYYIWDFNRSSFGRLEAGGRLSLGMWKETRFSLLAQGVVHFATAGDDPYVSRRGDVDAEIGMVLGRSFTLLGRPGFSDNKITYTWRPRGLPGEVSADLTIGVKPWPGTMILLKNESFSSLGGSVTTQAMSMAATKLGLSVVQEIFRSLSAELGYMQTLTGRNIIRERSLRFGVWYKF